jgi:hypothetical protein
VHAEKEIRYIDRVLMENLTVCRRIKFLHMCQLYSDSKKSSSSLSSFAPFAPSHSFCVPKFLPKEDAHKTNGPIPPQELFYPCQRTKATRHDKMVALVEHMLALHVKLAAATVPADKTLYQRQTRGEPAEPSKPPTGRPTRWCTSCMVWPRTRSRSQRGKQRRSPRRDGS